MRKIAGKENYRLIKKATSGSKVWVVSFNIDYEANMIEGIYSIKDKADSIAKEKGQDSMPGTNYSVEEYIVDDLEEGAW